MVASSPAGSPSSARAPSGVSSSWMPNWYPSWRISAGAACSPPASAVKRCRRLARVGHGGEVDGAAERDDERQVAGGQPAMHAWFGAFDPVATVAGHQRAQPWLRSRDDALDQGLTHVSRVRRRSDSLRCAALPTHFCPARRRLCTLIEAAARVPGGFA